MMNELHRDNDELEGRNLCVVRMHACFNECYLLFFSFKIFITNNHMEERNKISIWFKIFCLSSFGYDLNIFLLSFL